MQKFDIYQTITDKIVAAIEAGPGDVKLLGIAPVRPREGASAGLMPLEVR